MELKLCLCRAKEQRLLYLGFWIISCLLTQMHRNPVPCTQRGLCNHDKGKDGPHANTSGSRALLLGEVPSSDSTGAGRHGWWCSGQSQTLPQEATCVPGHHAKSPGLMWRSWLQGSHLHAPRPWGEGPPARGALTPSTLIWTQVFNFPVICPFSLSLGWLPCHFISCTILILQQRWRELTSPCPRAE